MYIIVVTRDEGVFDCVLEDRVFGKEEDAVIAIGKAVLEDVKKDWKYNYRLYRLEGWGNGD